MLKPPSDGGDGTLTFDFDGRNRRPPRDPVNALLSLGYALLSKDLTIALQAVGFDPYLGSIISPDTAARRSRWTSWRSFDR
jgi:CRISPR-associated protein Cas1